LDNKQTSESTKLAGRTYDVTDYRSNDPLASGLATTHEQVSDTYMEGEIKPIIDDVNGQDLPIKRKGYTK
jgi:hypothetical protein